MTKLKTIDQIVSPVNTSDGAGVKLKRSIGIPGLNHFDPFLMLDIFESENGADYSAGFPEHPHRGFETVTYMLQGKMRHFDNVGNMLSIKAGPKGGRFILLAADPINEPIVRHGPFVMNTKEEIYQAFEDYKLGKF